MDSITPQRQRLIDKIFSITEDMLTMAEKTDWTAVFKNEKSRQSLLKEFFYVKISSDESSQVISMIKNIMDIHHKIIHLMDQNKSQMSEEMRSMNCAQRALKAYAELL